MTDDMVEFGALWDAGRVTTAPDGTPILLRRPRPRIRRIRRFPR